MREIAKVSWIPALCPFEKWGHLTNDSRDEISLFLLGPGCIFIPCLEILFFVECVECVWKTLWNYNHRQTVGKVSTFDVFIASFPSPLFNVVQNWMVLVGNCCVTLQHWIRGRGEELYKRRWNYFFCTLTEAGWHTAQVRFIYITVPTTFCTFVYDCLKILGVVLNWKYDFFVNVYSFFEKQTQ